MNNKTISVTMLNQYIKSIVDRDYILSSLFVEGEISNFKHHYSGHMYFTLKDAQSAIKCVMFRSDAQGVPFTPEDGMHVILKGRLSVYERDGIYQIYITHMEPAGKGALYVAFEQLKERLEKEGLFDPTTKKTIPPYPKRVGIVTSSTGAAVRDVINVAMRRNPTIELVVYPVAVQGHGAAEQIAKAIDDFNVLRNVDVLIIGRGGGSIEDLWAFNEEIVARSIFASTIPIVSGVGHETDFTIADFVADLRAPTPSASAEMAVPDFLQMKREIFHLQLRLKSQISYFIQVNKQGWEKLNDALMLHKPVDILKQNQLYLDQLQSRLEHAYIRYIEKRKKDMSVYLAKLESLSPLKVLMRGYGIIQDRSNHIISSVKSCTIGEKLKIVLQDGDIECRVQSIENEGTMKNDGKEESEF